MISFLIGIITAAIVFYMSMIYGNAALALLGCFMCVFMCMCVRCVTVHVSCVDMQVCACP